MYELYLKITNPVLTFLPMLILKMNVKAMYDLQIMFCFLEFELNTTFKLILSQLRLEKLIGKGNQTTVILNPLWLGLGLWCLTPLLNNISVISSWSVL
jgi:hypothetical protein